MAFSNRVGNLQRKVNAVMEGSAPTDTGPRKLREINENLLFWHAFTRSANPVIALLKTRLQPRQQNRINSKWNQQPSCAGEQLAWRWPGDAPRLLICREIDLIISMAALGGAGKVLTDRATNSAHPMPLLAQGQIASHTTGLSSRC